MQEKPLLSLCMIVRDEEERLERCLNSVKEIVDEIIIVDTGSVDRTKGICLKYGARVYDFKWKENFAAARNFGLKEATGKWILWLDADEELILDNPHEFREILQTRITDLLGIPLINYYGTFPPEYNRSYLYISYRLFRNDQGFNFRGNIHEHLNIKELKNYPIMETLHDIQINHYGYMDDLTISKNKYERNLRILEKEKEKPDYDPWIDYHIASEYYRVKNYQEAFEWVNMSLRRFLAKQCLPPSLLYKLKYDILISLGSFAGAWPGIEKAIALYPDYVDLHFYKGLIFCAQEDFKEAINIFQHCLELGERNIKHLTLVGCGSFQAHYLIGKCYEGLGFYEEAKNAYQETLTLYPRHLEAKTSLMELKIYSEFHD